MGTQLPFWGGCRGRGRHVKRAPHDSTLPAHPGWLSSPLPTFPLDHVPHRGRRCLASSGSSADVGMEPAYPRRRPAGLFLDAMYSLQVSARSHVFRRLAFHRPPGDPPVPRATSSVPRRCPSSLEKPSSVSRAATAAFSVFPNPRASPPCCGCPGRSCGCPPLPAALTTTVWVTTWCRQNGTDENNPRAGLQIARLPQAQQRRLRGGAS